MESPNNPSTENTATTKILVIDDEVGIRRGCQRALRPQGFEVEEAASIQEGLQKVQAKTYDLALLDVMLPDGHGIELLGPIHEKDPDTVCVIITGYATVELAVQAIKQGAYDFISKPFTADLLLMTVEQGLERRRLSQEARRLQTIEQEAAELKRAKEEMERLNEFKSAFIWTVAHELRSPVGGAQSLLRTLNRGLAGKLNEDHRNILERVERRLDELLALINDLLALAATQTVGVEQPLERAPLLPALQRIIERLSPQANSKQVTLDFALPSADVAVWATQDGLDKIFSNLVGNAVKYTPTGGRVQVSVKEIGEQVTVSVSDTGIGIPADDLPHLGEDFFRARNAKASEIQGTGLGLSIVNQFVERFGGSIEVQSQEGKGTTFSVRLRKGAGEDKLSIL